MDQAIEDFIRKKYNLMIGTQTSEDIKIKIGSAVSLKKDIKIEVSGSNSVSGLPETIMVTSQDTVDALKSELTEIINAVKVVLQKTPPELASDVIDKGIVLSGGGSQLRSIDKLLTKVTGVPCQVSEDALLCAAKGTGIAVENLDTYLKSALWIKS